MKERSAKRLVIAREAIDAARRDLSVDAAGFAVDRAYYAMFYTVDALLAAQDLSFSSHGALHGAFGREFAKGGKLDSKYHRWLLEAFKARQSATYDAEALTAREEAQELIDQAEEFLATARDYLERPEQ